jgi:glycosyltransferase involved in cell wall biosynthesis
MCAMGSAPPTGTHGANPASRRLIDDRLRLLFVVPFGPRFDSRHGGRVVAQLIDKLVDRHEVAVVYQKLPGAPPMDSQLAARCDLVREVSLGSAAPLGQRVQHQRRVVQALLINRPSPVGAVYSRRFVRIVRDIVARWHPDVTQIEHDSLGYCLPSLRATRTATVLVCHDPGLNASRDLVRISRGRRQLAHRIDVLAWHRFWERTLPCADAVVAFTPQDARLISEQAPGTPVSSIPLGIDIPVAGSDPVGVPPPRITFVGGYVHPPNADAALSLMRSIMPLVRRQRPGLGLTLVGAGPTRMMQRAAGENDHITGPVASVAPYVDEAALLVLPIRLGGGMRVKLLEGLAAGKVVIASRLAAAGLEVDDGEHLRIAETDEEFARAILELLADPEARRRMGQSARAWAQDHLGWEQPVTLYENLYASLAPSAHPPVAKRSAGP